VQPSLLTSAAKHTELDVTNNQDTSVSVIHRKHCNGQHATGWSKTADAIPVADYPGPVAVDAAFGTACVASPTERANSLVRLNHYPEHVAGPASAGRAARRLMSNRRSQQRRTFPRRCSLARTAC
jgi:hypothetical protein